jgi:hypothetical protein
MFKECFPRMCSKLNTIYETAKLLPKNTIIIYTIMKYAGRESVVCSPFIFNSCRLKQLGWSDTSQEWIIPQKDHAPYRYVSNGGAQYVSYQLTAFIQSRSVARTSSCCRLFRQWEQFFILFLATELPDFVFLVILNPPPPLVVLSCMVMGLWWPLLTCLLTWVTQWYKPAYDMGTNFRSQYTSQDVWVMKRTFEQIMRLCHDCVFYELPHLWGQYLINCQYASLGWYHFNFFSFRAVSSLRRLAHTHHNMPVIWVVCRRKFNLLVLFDVVLSILPSPKMYGPCASRLLLNLLKDFIPTL